MSWGTFNIIKRINVEAEILQYCKTARKQGDYRIEPVKVL